MMTKFIVIVVLCGLAGVCVGRIVQNGQCDPDVPLEEDFNIEQFLGTWYELQRTESPEQNGDCAQFDISSTGNTINVQHTGVNSNWHEDSTGTATLASGTARLTLNIPLFNGHQRTSSKNGMLKMGEAKDFWVLLTNYNDFAVTYSCENISPTERSIYLWVLGRGRTYTNELIEARIRTVLNDLFSINLDSLRTIDHSDSACYVLSEIEPGQPIVLPGQCDANIPVVQNFNVAAFAGTWNEISSYHSESSSGSCVRAQYTLANGVINVVNSEVVNQALLTVSGTATLATDNSAKLRVTLNVNNQNVESDLWILATDYDNYAVSYTCENVGSNQQRIYSWILSKTRQLTPASEAAVNQVINSALVLNHAYYLPTDQSPTACFFYPEATDQPVIFRGQCDQSISAMSGFNTQAYMGLWHTIEQYPAPNQRGTCGNAFYVLNGANIDVLNSEVVDQSLSSATATAVSASNDGSGKLIVTFPGAGSAPAITADYWVLNTDYTTYALVYSCANIDYDTMQVTTWKLSRTKSLSQAANTAINQIMSTINVLDQRYFRPIDQTPSGCFYFPTPQPGVPVVFPGECNPNVAMQNFDLTRFAGTWHETQTYPQEEQSGHCINHAFTVATGVNNQLNLVTSSVTNQFLELTNGVATSTDNSGRLTIIITPQNGQSIQLPIWIIDTDYDDYALAYSCANTVINTNTDFREVWSWKLSRTSQQSQAGNLAINNAIANIDVLDNRYYENIDQSPQACFYLPEIPPGQPIILPGQCDNNIRVVENFNANMFTGTWNQVSSYFSESSTGSCVRAQYTLANDVINVVNSEVVNQALQTVSGTATVISNDNSAKLRVVLNVNNQNVESELWILATDYDNYAVSYTCENVGSDQQRVYSWILSRTRQLTPASEAQVNQVVNSVLVLNNVYYTPTDQSATGCFFYPEATDQPVVFRGQCDQSLPAMSGFNAQAYMGLWHTIEQYPAPNQRGTCGNAFYVLNGANIDVLNSEVVDQSLSTATATAVAASGDGSGKLIVTFPGAGTAPALSSDYWVMGTDYTTYALVYSCNNVDHDNMQVSTWKLSRTKSLSQAANTAINQIMNNINVLDQRYFRPIDQTPGGCFYFPTSQPGVPVVFPGDCNPNIGMQTFVLSQFQGTWYEIHAYPKEEQPGHCINHVFSVAGNNQLNLVSSSIAELSLDTTNGIVTSTDNSGRLTVTITLEGGQSVQIPFWIVATDYTDYALGYACINTVVNTNQDFRAVWSWKLSRTRQLSQAANTAINTAIANIDVLDNRYYENIDHSAQACFYLPDIERGNPIILPGQCDNNIGVVQNFNVDRFMGTWHQISSYYSESSTGSCVRAQYTFANGVVNILNSEVVNQALQTVSGTATVTSNDNSAKLRVILNVNNQNVESDLWILATDYDNYAISYTCENINNEQQRIYSWILSKTRQLPQESQVQVNQVVNSVLVLTDNYYTPTDQSPNGCFFYPEATDQPVIFRGQCDQSLPAIPGFNTQAYMGLWHTIEQYPAPNQRGTCGNAFYVLNGANIDVLNSEVVDQSLSTATATAVAASGDGSGKLIVTFPGAGTAPAVSADYWVMSTDYTTYALVYSCSNVDHDNMQVSTWKLSRTKFLSQAANTAINQIMNNINVLDQRYFRPIDQTAAGCFYFPTLQPGVPRVFPGECNPNIGMQNFVLSQFAGTWFEIQSYPNEVQSGHCINHIFTVLGANQLNLVSSSVTGLSLNTANGLVTSTDNSGRLTASITTEGGQSIQIPFWIVATDYDDYALAYSCVNTVVNTNPDYRAVWSWKLSRERQQSQAGNTAINTAIASIDVLDNRYYENIDNSEEACFYLPEIAPGQPVIIPGQCDNSIRGVDNFNLDRFGGRWRLIESYATDDQTGTCNVARYSVRDATTLDIEHSEVVGQTLRTISGSATISGTEGRLRITYSGGQSLEYTILDTDYDSYALAYRCENVSPETRRVWSWKLSRDSTLSTTANNNINQIINSINVLDNRYFSAVDHSETGCFFFPEVDENRAVRFRGQCNPNFPVVQGFELQRYMGLWHDIQSYPVQFQSGTCPNSFYVLVSGNVNILNSQVVDQRLDTMTGTGQLSGTDGSGRLTVTYTTNGQPVTSNYWVLATDYTNYALVYSCENYDDEFMTVFSWKLSRTKTISTAANQAMNAVINAHNILDQRYYTNRDQSQEGCFYFPESFSFSPVIFPGQCNNGIAAISNFNAEQFSGQWHEISSYYYLESNGQCVNHRFDFVAATSTLSLNSFNVFNQILQSSSSPVNVATTDGSGRLTINIIVDGQTQTIPYWILATDYTDYALVYGCVNLNSDYRRIYNWKLSRTRTLSAAGNTAINTAMATVDVIDNRYYRNVQQTNNACFYLPDLTLNEPVTFDGQCDENIPVVSNFNAARYLGRWRLIQTYFAEFQSGTCSEANYAQTSGSTIEVLNTQVINQQLDSITGSATAAVDGSGKLTVTFPSNPTSSELWILATDYDSYALAYSCENIDINRRRVFSWKLSRTNTLTDAANIAIDQVVNSINVLNDRYYSTVERTDAACFYYPVPDDNPVVFRGQCDLSIPAFPNFEPSRYTGTWYDVQSYPTEFQTGNCPRARYTLKDDGTVDLVNSQVVDQLLQSLSGNAVVVSDDNSAKMDVTININGVDVTTKLWILTIDYDSYALAYSCTNLNAETRLVSSWKLSRTPTLTAAANTAINAVINSVQVLDQRYFMPRTNTPEACFFYPDNNGGDVILPGQCSDSASVPAITDFDINAFAGTWYEISRFPSGLQTGECVYNQYATSGTSGYTITQSTIHNDRINSANIQATVDGNSRGVLNIDIDGVPLTNVYILDTRYNEYALLYGCRNLDNNEKQIYSWKLSRSQAGLSAEANTIINGLVSNNVDLHEMYYKVTGQDTEACFYYPVFETLPSNIVMPVPCLSGVRGVSNFQKANYLGRWFETARYPSTNYKGQCNQCSYSETSLGQTRTYFTFTEVIEQSLETQLANAVQASDSVGEFNLEVDDNGDIRRFNYYVVATDYISYSLVYSCANLNDGTSIVNAWKRSRTPSLSSAASIAIDTAIANTRGITEDYFQPTSQSAEDCFYIPELNPQEAPLFRGQCEDVTGVEGFNIDRYSGWWHEIERYPMDRLAGECRSTEYTLDGSAPQNFAVVDNYVNNNEGVRLPGTVDATQDGRLRRTIIGRPVEDVWVLATDYETYALLYSCENVDSEYKRVWSAIHSRSRDPISDAVKAVIAPIIANNDVLVEHLYMPVDQSDETCFHHPSIIEGDIVIPGQCDPAIPVLQNFDVAAFASDWYHIERYDDVTNSCIGTRIAFDEDSNSIDVLNYEVVVDELETTEGTARIVSTDGSATLELTLPVAGSEDATTSTTVSVLASDYTNYALVYSCVNINAYQRRVQAWKLSRERTMSSTSTAAINAVIQSRPELHQPYFKQISQYEECPEPSSSLIIKSSIIMIFVCALIQQLL